MQIFENLSKNWKDVEGVLHHHSLLYVPEIICFKLISHQNNDPLASHIGIAQIHELIAGKYYWPIFYCNIEAYAKGCDVCLSSKTVCHKSYNNLQ